MIKTVLGLVFMLALLPALLPAYAVSRLFGIDPFRMDDIGISWLIFILITVAVVCLYIGIGIGYWL